jgi:hypothetical protein
MHEVPVIGDAIDRGILMLWTAPPPAHRCHGCGRY